VRQVASTSHLPARVSGKDGKTGRGMPADRLTGGARCSWMAELALTVALTIGGGFGLSRADVGVKFLRKVANFGLIWRPVPDCKTSIPGSNPGGASNFS